MLKFFGFLIRIFIRYIIDGIMEEGLNYVFFDVLVKED